MSPALMRESDAKMRASAFAFQASFSRVTSTTTAP